MTTHKCHVTGCERRYYAKGWCEMHYQRVEKYGHPDGGKQNHASPVERFERRRPVKEPCLCWIWTGTLAPNGYGRFQIGGKGSPHVGAHRFAYELEHGPIPEGLVVMHSCDNPACVNPAHLSVGTHKDNSQDMIRKGRHKRIAPKGTDNGKAKLDADMVRFIRQTKETNAELSRRLGLSPNTIRGVRIGRTWSHVA